MTAAAAYTPPIDGRAEAIAKTAERMKPAGKIAGRSLAFAYRCAMREGGVDYIARSTRGRWYSICCLDVGCGRASTDPETGFGWREISTPATVAILEAAVVLKLGTVPDADDEASPARTAAPRRAAKVAVAPKAPSARDPRLPAVGKEIVRAWKGDQIRVRVLEDGFHFRGQRFGSLSKVAQHITGKVWNGYAFFGLTARTEEKR